MKKNPFSIFDFLGYVFPGAFAIFLIYIFSELKDVKGVILLYRSIKEIKLSFEYDDTILLTLASYVLGHFIAYVSSLTVEQFSIWLYGYPSSFLLNKPGPSHYFSNLDKWWKTRSGICSLFWRIIIACFLLPLTISSIIFSRFLCVKKFFVKPLDQILIKSIEYKYDKLAIYLRLSDAVDSSNVNVENSQNRRNRNFIDDTDFHRVIYHYEYELQKTHANKMDNYVALYGFLRAITLIFNCLFLYLLIFIALPSIDFKTTIDWHIILLLVVVLFTAYIFFMGYMKFYRRFTLESFMCLVIDNSYVTSLNLNQTDEALVSNE